MSSAEPERPEPESVPDLVGDKVGKYEIVRAIGAGGMGHVYEALNTAINKRVAMKFVHPEVASSKDAVARFQREAQAASAVESSHIVEIFDSGETDDGRPFIVMELLRGEDLGHRIRRCGRLELDEALHIVCQILRGLHRAHEAGIVHRDLKPDNVFLVERDDDANFAKILDFGISKIQRRGDTPSKTITRQGTVLGTPFYMSPEQAQALPDVDGRADLWSAGAILYECLTGRPPHSGGTYEQVIVNICMNDADDIRAHNPAVPEGIALVLQRALARERDERYENARAFLDDLISSSDGILPSGPRLAVSTPTPRRGESVRAPRSGPTTDSEEFADTVEVSGGPSRVGWATSGGTVSRTRDRRLVFAVGGISILAGIAMGTFFFFKPSAEPSTSQAATAQPAAGQAAQVTTKLRTNAANARFFVDDKELPDGQLAGPNGSVATVRVEADGFAPRDVEVRLATGQRAQTIELSPAPRVEPANEEEAAGGDPKPDETAEEKAPLPQLPTTATKKPVIAVPPMATSTATATPKSGAPKPPPSQGSGSSGVASGLQLKTN